MKELLDRVNVFELKVLEAVKTIKRLKQENEILFKENFRLKEEINQLSNKEKESLTFVEKSTFDKAGQNNNKINIEQVKEELDKCLIELNECIELVGAK